jgi:nitroimidazol reductase NimA-like FMN-containing flavoprotein (pyridoxamine 5'-phosphate oxidase superfamily)
MTAPDGAGRTMVEVSGTEALWLLEGAGSGRLAYAQREAVLVRPAVHVFEYGRLIVRAPVQTAALSGRGLLTYQADDLCPPPRSGWSVTVTGPAEEIDDAHEAAHYRRTLRGWVHGPHDAVLRIRPQQVSGYRLHPGQTR